LYFLLEKVLNSITNYPTPQQIPKTIVFVDSRNKVSLIAQYLRNALLSLFSSFGLEISSMPKYSLSGAKEYYINNIINIFHLYIAQKDKDIRYLEFSQPSSCTRIIVATISLGIGVNISDVERVVTWDFPLDKEVGPGVYRSIEHLPSGPASSNFQTPNLIGPGVYRSIEYLPSGPASSSFQTPNLTGPGVHRSS
jgi:hypothetical protein